MFVLCVCDFNNKASVKTYIGILICLCVDARIHTYKMMKLQQSATCPVCLEGAHTDTDGYQENCNQWHAHLIRIDLCRLCEAGWACQHSGKHKCTAPSSTSAEGSTYCTCRLGYVQIDLTTCGPCPPDSICAGGNDAAVSCSSPLAAGVDKNYSYCPCSARYIVDAMRGECEMCPANFYCPGFANMTGVNPSHTVYARRCPLHATSDTGSQNANDRVCSTAYFILNGITQAPCVPCFEGYYCPGGGIARIKCLRETTTLGSLQTANQVTDCVCLDTREQLAVTTTARQQQQCVCSPGWVQSRCVYISPQSCDT